MNSQLNMHFYLIFLSLVLALGCPNRRDASGKQDGKETKKKPSSRPKHVEQDDKKTKEKLPSRLNVKPDDKKTKGKLPSRPKHVEQDDKNDWPAQLKESEDLANNLDAARALNDEYKDWAASLAKRDKDRKLPKKNKYRTFVEVKGMIKALRNKTGHYGNLTKFKEWAKQGKWRQFSRHEHHYDWWMFPINRKSDRMGQAYAVYEEEIKALKQDKDWLEDYRLGAILVMQSWGWDVAKERLFDFPTKDQKWDKWEVRLGKMANSLLLFEQWDLHKSLREYVKHLKKEGINLSKEYHPYFPSVYKK